jgi:hypothetical protein
VAVHESKESWEHFRDRILGPKMQQGVDGGFAGPTQETAIDVYKLMR